MTNLTGLSPDPALVGKRPVTTVDNSINHGPRIPDCVTGRPPADVRAEAINVEDDSSVSLKPADLIRGAGRHHLALFVRHPEPGARSGQRSAMLQWASDVNYACLQRWLNAGGQIRIACHGARPAHGHHESGLDVLCANVDAEPLR